MYEDMNTSIISPAVNGSRCLEFWYYMDANSKAKFNVVLRDVINSRQTTLVWSVSNAQDSQKERNSWRQAIIPILASTNKYYQVIYRCKDMCTFLKY